MDRMSDLADAEVPPPERCLHCDAPPPLGPLGLCAACGSSRRWALLYSRRHPRWTPAWELHLRRLAERARQHLPLFEEGYEPPAPGEGRRRKRLPCVPRVFRCQPRRQLKQEGEGDR